MDKVKQTVGAKSRKRHIAPETWKKNVAKNVMLVLLNLIY
jgi:hypothetical protein